MQKSTKNESETENSTNSPSLSLYTDKIDIDLVRALSKLGCVIVSQNGDKTAYDVYKHK